MSEDEVAAEEKNNQAPGVEDLPPASETPVFLHDDPPSGKTDYAKWCLMHDMSEQDAISSGVNPGTLRIAKNWLVKNGYKKKGRNGNGGKGKSEVALLTSSPKGVQQFPKGAPPEVIINEISVPMEDGDIPGFEKGMKFGMSMVVMGVRVAQELSAMGIQQARPLLDMAASMRQGEERAAKNAAFEAATMAAGEVQGNLAPLLASLNKSSEGDPMKAMMVRTFEPMLQGILGKVIPGMGKATEPQGWTRKSV